MPQETIVAPDLGRLVGTRDEDAAVSQINVDVALTNSFGFGWHNVTLAISRFRG